jgi:hypothetical protein
MDHCENCEKDVEGVWIDFGIGGYEYWGYRGFHTDLQYVCPECEGRLPNQYRSPREQALAESC